MPGNQMVDPAVSRRKFEREIAEHRAMGATYRRKGWFLIDAEFPEAFVIFSSTKLKPSPLVVGVVVDFTDYDLQPPSLRFVDPHTRGPLKHKDLGIRMLRRLAGDPAMPPFAMQPGVPFGVAIPQAFQIQDMVQSNGPDDIPFVCLPGIREYHDNPAHSGDPWLLHRNSGEGSLAFILDKVWTYGINPIEQYQWQLQIQIMGLAAPQITAVPE